MAAKRGGTGANQHAEQTGSFTGLQTVAQRAAQSGVSVITQRRQMPASRSIYGLVDAEHMLNEVSRSASRRGMRCGRRSGSWPPFAPATSLATVRRQLRKIFLNWQQGRPATKPPRP